MEELRQSLESFINIDLAQIIISNARKSTDIKKIKIRPVLLKAILFYQISVYEGTKVKHDNCNKMETIEKILGWMGTFKQLEADTPTEHMTVLVSKKGKVSINCKKQKNNICQKDLMHNRKKHYIIEEGTPVEFLVDLGVMTQSGMIVRTKYDKFRQINRFLEFIEDILPQLPKERKVSIIDFGCGKSYLSFAMYYYLKEIKGYDLSVTGLDLKEDVIEHCNKLAQKYGYEDLHFLVGDIKDYDKQSSVDMVVTLHACDTATDYALDKAVKWGASVILSVPCCQHEMNGQIKQEVFAPVFQYGLIKERFAALCTDAMRAELLNCYGYETQILEFIDMEHTPKNILIRAIKTEKVGKNKEEYEKLRDFLHVNPMLEALLAQNGEE